MIELTRCTVSQAELALLDNNNDARAAVEWINGGKVDVWTVQKSRKQRRHEVSKMRVRSCTVRKTRRWMKKRMERPFCSRHRPPLLTWQPTSWMTNFSRCFEALMR